MKYQNLIVLLPCHSLEDFPLHHKGEAAQGLLACWTALWHPALIASSKDTPNWRRLVDPPDSVAGCLITIPPVAESDIPAGFIARAQSEGARVIRQQIDRRAILSEALEGLDGPGADLDDDLAGDFLALGFCYLQVQLLTRQMRYSSNLDEIHFQKQAVRAAEAAVAGNADEARKLLGMCFDVLAEERNHYYPVDAYLIDLTLVAPSTIGPALEAELDMPVPVNLMLSAETLDLLAREQPALLTKIKNRLDEQKISLVGGEWDELPLPLIGYEAIHEQFRAGLEKIEQLLHYRPVGFGRRRFGLTPGLPTILKQLGYLGAIHATLDDGRFPAGTQAKISWEGIDGTTIDTLARVPLDASKADSFLNFAVKMGESMDMDHIAASTLAHWPGVICPWYDDLRRVASYVPALGKFVTLDEFFRNTDFPSQLDRFEPDAYRSPYLKQAVEQKQRDPISRHARRLQRQTLLQAVEGLHLLYSGMTGKAFSPLPPREEILRAGELPDPDQEARWDAQLTQCHAELAERLSAALPRAEAESRDGYLLLNPLSFTRRVSAETPKLTELPPVERPIYAVEPDAAGETGVKRVVADVPSMGFLWIDGRGPGGGKKTSSRKPLPPLAEENLLQNEYMRVLIDPTTGAIRSIRDYHSRSNRLSQQLALRRIDPHGQAEYSVMAADEIRITAADTVLGQIEVTGRLLNLQAERLADFRQVYRIRRGGRTLEIDIELTPREMPAGAAWETYYAARFAWGSELASLVRAINLARGETELKRFESPHYVEIQDDQTRTAILPGGLPYHRLVDDRVLDTLLITAGETARRFRLGVAIDSPQPQQEAVQFLVPPIVLRQNAAPPAGAASSWLFHVSAKNVLVTHWEPLWENEQVVGFRARLQETAGRAGPVGLSCFRTPGKAHRLDLCGKSLGDLKIVEEKIEIPFKAHQWVHVEARW